MVCLRRHFVPNPVQRNYCRRGHTKPRRHLFIHTGYDSNGNLIKEYQEHGTGGATGTVNTSTSLYVGYGYDNTTGSGWDGALGANVTTATYGYRPTNLLYVTSGTNTARALSYSYGTSGATNDEINQLDSIADGSGSMSSSGTITATPSSTLDSLGYLGDGTITAETYNQPNIGYNLLDNTVVGSVSQPNLDQYGRVQDMVWKDYGSGNTRDGYQYGYDQRGDVIYRANLTAGAAQLDQIYSYDYLGQLKGLSQGTLARDGNGNVLLNGNGQPSLTGTANFAQNWSPDGNGNWTAFSQTGSNATDQTRTPTLGNEIQSITTNSGTQWIQPVYDNGNAGAGNMTTMPQPDNESVGLTCVYDAWNRLVEVENGSAVVANYVYDGLNRLIETESNFSGGSPQTVVHSYYAGQQLLETRTATGSGAASQTGQSLTPAYQYVWSPRGENAPVLRDTYSGGALVSGDRLYYLTDANSNVTAVANSSGVVQEQYSYDAYGNVTFYSPNWASSSTTSSVGNTVLFGGMQRDSLTNVYYDRARWYNPSTGGFLSRDPAQSDANLYRYAGNDPISETDPSGMSGDGS